MRRIHLVSSPLLLLALASFACSPGEPEPRNSGMSGFLEGQATALKSARELRLRRAVDVVEGTLSSMQESGATTWTPTAVADRLVRSLDPAERGQARATADVTGDVRYVVGEPTGPWQVVLIPLDSKHVLRLEGYGADTTTPLVVKEIRVDPYG